MIRFRFSLFGCLLLLSPARMQVDAHIAEAGDLHRIVQLSSPARHIVSLAPSITETLFAIGAVDQIVVVTADLLPDENGLTALYPEWGTLSEVKNHTVLRIDPDLVSRPGPRAVDGLGPLLRILQFTRDQEVFCPRGDP